mmetsp:Transcript_31020/g.92298  ORF Transcript_31020/g.92298 Transcript_31020/m.92298 type:complete len:265 (-) Transcript_31020:614-1408(-)
MESRRFSCMRLLLWRRSSSPCAATLEASSSSSLHLCCSPAFSSRRSETSLAWHLRTASSSELSTAACRCASSSLSVSSSTISEETLQSRDTLSSSISLINCAFFCFRAWIWGLASSIQALAMPRRSRRISSSSWLSFSFWWSRMLSWSLFRSASAACFCRSSSSFISVVPISASWQVLCSAYSEILSRSSQFVVSKAWFSVRNFTTSSASCCGISSLARCSSSVRVRFKTAFSLRRKASSSYSFPQETFPRIRPLSTSFAGKPR